jgi:CubicO group peptidase (beta-lactamase class C family)
MKLKFCTAVVGMLAFIPASAADAPKPESAYPGAEWRVVEPESLGFSSAKLEAAQAYFEDIGGDALVAVRHGEVFLAWGDIDEPIANYSIRKSYLNALLGIEHGRGNLNLDATLADLGIDDKDRLTPSEKEARVRDLLTTSSGVYHPASHESKEQKGARPPRGSFQRGAFFYYNNWDFNVLGHLFESMAGTDIFSSFKHRIADPIGMQDFDLDQTAYRRDSSSNYPAYEFKSSARDDARFGLLYLRNGRWGDAQLIPPDWIAMSTKRQVITGSHYYYDYGYLWWVDDENGNYFARGNSGQYIAVLPASDMVIVFRADPGSILSKWLGLRVQAQESFLLIPKILGALHNRL